jgi:DNA replication protein DnaC
VGYRVRYTTSAGLIERLTAAMADRTLAQRVRYFAGFDLLIVDEFGFDRLERREAQDAASLFFKVIDARMQKHATALVTNVDFGTWGEYLGDPPLATALMDRIVDGAIIIKINGKSYRAARAQPTKTTRPG